MAETESSYVDYEQLLSISFSPHNFANNLVLATNDPTDTPLDLNTPLSRVLFDVQEVDTHIDSLTTTHALSLITYTKNSVSSSGRILEELEAQVEILTEGYERLEREIGERYEQAEEVRQVVDRLWSTVKLGRDVGRCLTLARQLEAQLGELKRPIGGDVVGGKKEDHRAMVRGANSLLQFRQIFVSTNLDRSLLERVNVVKSLKDEIVDPAERHIVARAELLVGQFSISSLLDKDGQQQQRSGYSSQTPAASNFAQAEETRARLTSALLALYLLSPLPASENLADSGTPSFSPTLLLSALEEYLHRAITASLASLGRSLGTLPSLDETLRLVSGRCQNIVALENLLDSIKVPAPQLLPNTLSIEDAQVSGEDDAPATVDRDDDNDNEASLTQTTPPSAPRPALLQPLLTHLDTATLPSYFWRSLASKLSPRTAELMRRGGAPARSLRANKDAVANAIRDCVNKGSALPASGNSRGKEVRVSNWEREAGVMVGAVVGGIGR